MDYKYNYCFNSSTHFFDEQMEYKFNLDAKYIPEWNNTIVYIMVFDKNDHALSAVVSVEHTECYHGRLTADEVKKELCRMYYKALAKIPDNFEL